MDLNSEEFEPLYKKVFGDYDKDQSGFIEVGELKESMVEFYKTLEQMNPGSSYEVTDDMVNTELASFDYNQDGKLSYDEFKDYAKKMYSKMFAPPSE